MPAGTFVSSTLIEYVPIIEGPFFCSCWCCGDGVAAGVMTPVWDMHKYIEYWYWEYDENDVDFSDMCRHAYVSSLYTQALSDACLCMHSEYPRLSMDSNIPIVCVCNYIHLPSDNAFCLRASMYTWIHKYVHMHLCMHTYVYMSWHILRSTHLATVLFVCVLMHVAVQLSHYCW